MGFKLKLRHSFDGFDIDITLSGGPGVTALFGPSGSGKTTVIRALAGTLKAQSGSARLQDRTLFDSATGLHLPCAKRRIGYVFQDGRLFPHLNVAENLSFSAPYRKGPAQKADTLIDLLGLKKLLKRRPKTLSGGEIQRVALARALLSNPDMLLMDEPLAALDGPRKDDILPYLDRLKSETQIPILYVTHSVEEMARLADQVALIANGRILIQGPVFDILASAEAIPLIGVREAGSILRVIVENHTQDGLSHMRLGTERLELPHVNARPGTHLRLRILAQDIILATQKPQGLSARNILPVTVTHIDQGRGPGVAVTLKIADQTLLARITEKSCSELSLKEKQKIFAIVKSTSVARNSISH
ncbi:MAG: molybdenum ABC transporter ATP-binding protein [Paracoccaceae bacterium]